MQNCCEVLAVMVQAATSSPAMHVHWLCCPATANHQVVPFKTAVGGICCVATITSLVVPVLTLLTLDTVPPRRGCCMRMYCCAECEERRLPVAESAARRAKWLIDRQRLCCIVHAATSHKPSWSTRWQLLRAALQCDDHATKCGPLHVVSSVVECMMHVVSEYMWPGGQCGLRTVFQ
jgi:hypothetical protein